MTTSQAGASTAVSRTTTAQRFVPFESLPTSRVNGMRIGYLLMAVGLVLVKWPLFFKNGGVGALPLFEGVVAAAPLPRLCLSALAAAPLPRLCATSTAVAVVPALSRGSGA